MSLVKVTNNTNKNQKFKLPNGNEQELKKDDFIIIGNINEIKNDYIVSLLLKGFKISTIEDDSNSSKDASNNINIESNNKPKRKRGRPRKVKED